MGYGEKSLARHLQKDYIIKNGNVYPKEDAYFEYGGKKRKICRFNDFWILSFANKSGLITSCSKIISHAALLRIADECEIDTSKIELTWLSIPKSDKDKAVVECRFPGCPPIVGEASSGNLNGGMHSYCATMALKRGIDRVITHVTGLYHQGFYSSSEIGGEFSKEGSSDTDREEKLTRKDLVDEVRGIFEKKKMSVKKLNSELQLLSGDESTNIANASPEILKVFIEAQS